MKMSEPKAYKELMEVVKAKVKPERDKVNRDSHKKNWWLYGDYRKNLRRATIGTSQVLVRSMVSEHHILARVDKNAVFSHSLVVFAFDDNYHFALLQSWVHEVWLRRLASTLESRNRYTPTDCFLTFPFPQNATVDRKGISDSIGQSFYQFRQTVLQNRKIGLTKIYNLLNNPSCQDFDIKQIRVLQTEMDNAILSCYDFEDIDLQYNFYANDRNKTRFMPSLNAQREIFKRLIELNQDISLQESAQGITVQVDENQGFEEDSDE